MEEREVDSLPDIHPVRAAYLAGMLPATNCNRGVWTRPLAGNRWAVRCNWDRGSANWGSQYGILTDGPNGMTYQAMPDAETLPGPFGSDRARHEAYAALR